MSTDDNLQMSTCSVVAISLHSWPFAGRRIGKSLVVNEWRKSPTGKDQRHPTGVGRAESAQERTGGMVSILSFSLKKLQRVRGLFKGDSC